MKDMNKITRNNNNNSTEFNLDDGLGKESSHSTCSTRSAATATSTRKWRDLVERSKSLKNKAQQKQKPVAEVVSSTNTPITVHIKTQDNKTFTLTGFYPRDPISKLQEILSTKVGISSSNQTLSFHGTKLTSSSSSSSSTTTTTTTTTTTFQDANIKHGCTVELQTMIIYVKIGEDELVKVPVEASMTVKEVQLFLRNNHDIQDDELLRYNGLVLDDVERSLDSYGISPNIFLEVNAKKKKKKNTPNVFVATGGGTSIKDRLAMFSKAANSTFIK